MIGQSDGPMAVINQSLVGVVQGLRAGDGGGRSGIHAYMKNARLD